MGESSQKGSPNRKEESPRRVAGGLLRASPRRAHHRHRYSLDGTDNPRLDQRDTPTSGKGEGKKLVQDQLTSGKGKGKETDESFHEGLIEFPAIGIHTLGC